VFPVLISIGPVKVYNMSLILILAIWFGLFVVWKRAKELHYEEKELFDTAMIVLIWVFLCARIGYALIHLTDFSTNFISILNIFQRPGWFFPTGLIAGGVSVLVQTKRRKLDAFQVMDIFVTGLAIFQAGLALGEFLNGTGYGLATNMFFGINFSGLYDRRIPVQLLELVSYSLCFIYLWKVEGIYRTFAWYRRNKSQAATGFLVSIYLIWWGVTETVALLLRTPTMSWGGVRLDIFFPVLMGILGGIVMLMRRSGLSGQDFLEYFGLFDKEKMREKRLKMIKESLQK